MNSENAAQLQALKGMNLWFVIFVYNDLFIL